jgi:tetratricopeptide (TPR) repeat protein
LLVLALAACQKSGDAYLALGNQFLKEGKLEEASINFRAAVPKLQNAGEAHYGLAQVALRQNRKGEAFAELMQAVPLLPQRDDLKIQLADIALQELARDERKPIKLYEEASKTIQGLEASQPKAYEPRRLRALFTLIDRKFTDAIPLLEALLKEQPSDRRVSLPLVEAYFFTNQEARAEQLAKDFLSRDRSFGEMATILQRYYLVKKRDADAEALLKQMVEWNPAFAEPRLQLAGFYAAASQVDAAEGVLKPLFDQKDKFPDAHLRAADTYLTVRQFDAARRHLEEGSQVDGERRQAYQKKLAHLDWAQGKREEAIQRVTKLAQTNLDDELRRMRGSFLLARGKREDMDTVIQDYSDLSKKSPSEEILLYQLGRAYRVKGDRENAWKYLQQAVRGNQNYLAPKLALAEMTGEQGRYQETLQYLDQILTIDTNNPEVRVARAATLRNLGRLREAQAEVQKLLARNPNDADVLVEQGLQLLADNRPKDAEALFRRMYRTGQGDVRPALGLVRSLMAQRNPEAALTLLESESKATPNSLEVRFLMGNLAAEAGQGSKSIQIFEELIKKFPDNPEALVRLGQLKLDANQPDGIKLLQRAASVAPQNSAVQSSLATALHQAGKNDEAQPYYERALQLDPSNHFASNNLAYLYAQKKQNLTEAARLAQVAVAASPKNPLYLDTQVFVALQAGDYAAADRFLRPWLQSQPNHPVALRYQGILYRQAGQSNRARETWQKALQNQKDKTERAELERLLSSL